MGDLAAPEKNRDSHSFPPLDEAPNIAYLVDKIMRVGARADLNFLNYDDGLLLAAALVFLLLRVAELPIVQNATDRRLGFRRHLDKIQAVGLGHLQGLIQRQDAKLVPLRSDDPNLAGANPVVDS